MDKGGAKNLYMTKKLFLKIKNQYSKFSSFAIWDKNDIGNIKIIEQNLSRLHSRFVFVGLNASAFVKPFGNFHYIHRGGRDGWLAESLGVAPLFRGAYMTDIFKNDKSPRQNDVDMGKKNSVKNIKDFQREVQLVATKNTVLIAFGRKAYQHLLKNKIEAEFLPHYASRHFGHKSQFFKEVKKLHKRLAR